MSGISDKNKKNLVSQDSAGGLCTEREKGDFPGVRLASAPKLLLHSCCGPCSTSVIERLANEYKITVFYFNPCITAPEEYEKRKENQIRFIEDYNQDENRGYYVDFIEGNYIPEKYLELVKGLEGEPEGGARCEVCIGQRIEETAKKAKSLSMDCFTTTLSVSPHKSYPLISELGKKFEDVYGIDFLDLDFKKKAGFQRSVQLAKEHGLYRQDYCGCVFSKRL